MKKLITITIIFSTIGFNTTGQEYHSFPDSNAIWSVTDCYYCVGQNCCETTHYGLEQDTLIDSTIYNKLYKTQDSSYNLKNATYVGGIREDTNRNVYFRPRGESYDTLIYNFSLKLTDTVRIYQGNYYGVVDSIDSVKIKNSYRKLYGIETGYGTDKWVEGIGSLTSLLNPFYYPNTVDNWSDLICFKQNDTIVYKNNPYNNSCYYRPTGINEREEDRAKINVYPNPINQNDILTIENLSIGKKYKFILFNSLGQKSLEKQISYHQREISINDEEINDKLYFYKLISLDGKQIYSGKLLAE